MKIPYIRKYSPVEIIFIVFILGLFLWNAANQFFGRMPEQIVSSKRKISNERLGQIGLYITGNFGKGKFSENSINELQLPDFKESLEDPFSENEKRFKYYLSNQNLYLISLGSDEKLSNEWSNFTGDTNHFSYEASNGTFSSGDIIHRVNLDAGEKEDD